MPELNEYHLWMLEQTKKSVAYWTEHPMSPEECSNQFKRLREQRIARESRSDFRFSEDK